MAKVRRKSEWDRHVDRYWALNRAHGGIMRQVVKVAGKEPEAEDFLREVAALVEAKMKDEVECGWKLRPPDPLRPDDPGPAVDLSFYRSPV